MSDTTPEGVRGSEILLTGCRRKAEVLLKGWWTLGDGSSRLFEWKAAARIGGVIPLQGVVVAPLGCSEHGPGSYPYPIAGLIIAPDGFADAALARGNVFIPLDGEASFDHDLRATAVVRTETRDAAGPLVTVSIDKAPGRTDVHEGLRVGDAFAWGDRRGTIVRVVEPQGGKFGAIGWVEVRVSYGS
jgi:hypothetical protein